MEVLVDPTFNIDFSSSPPPYGEEDDDQSGDSGERAAPSSLFDGGLIYAAGRCPEFYCGESSESSSSIGTPDDGDDENDEFSSKRDEEDEEEEAQSKLNGLNYLDSLEASLPPKRRLSSHFTGKSKSFTDLSQVSTVKELQKQENPFNKRRRVLIASKWSRRSSFYNWSNPKSMPLLPVIEEQDDYEYNDDEADDEKKSQEEVQLRQLDNRVPQSYAAHMRLRLGSFKSRSFSLADLQEHDI